jgi:hypothetical protein
LKIVSKLDANKQLQNKSIVAIVPLLDCKASFLKWQQQRNSNDLVSKPHSLGKTQA